MQSVLHGQGHTTEHRYACSSKNRHAQHLPGFIAVVWCTSRGKAQQTDGYTDTAAVMADIQCISLSLSLPVCSVGKDKAECADAVLCQTKVWDALSAMTKQRVRMMCSVSNDKAENQDAVSAVTHASTGHLHCLGVLHQQWQSRGFGCGQQPPCRPCRAPPRPLTPPYLCRAQPQ